MCVREREGKEKGSERGREQERNEERERLTGAEVGERSSRKEKERVVWGDERKLLIRMMMRLVELLCIIWGGLGGFGVAPERERER